MSVQDGKGWNPYLAGALTGLLMVLSIGLVGKFFGASTTFARTAAMLESLVSPERVAAMPYFVKWGYPLHSSIYNILWFRYISSMAQITFGQRGNRDGLLS